MLAKHRVPMMTPKRNDTDISKVWQKMTLVSCWRCLFYSTEVSGDSLFIKTPVQPSTGPPLTGPPSTVH
ncbi:unnamed protein product, partial [Adineta ricciae]